MTELIFNDGWCSSDVQNAIADSLAEVADIDGAYIEIGSWEGMSTVFIANKIYPHTLITVDPYFEDSKENQYFKSIGETRTAYQTFTHNIKVGTQDNVKHYHMTAENFFERVWGGPIKFVYLDGPHDYHSVLDELDLIRQFLVDGAIILGDDYYSSDIRDAFETAFPSTKEHPLAPYNTGIYRKV
jgi:hypothetical protein